MSTLDFLLTVPLSAQYWLHLRTMPTYLLRSIQRQLGKCVCGPAYRHTYRTHAYKLAHAYKHLKEVLWLISSTMWTNVLAA